MMELIIQLIIGLIVIVMGISNCKGNISLLHSYHVKRVKKSDIVPFGKMVGIGSIIIGVSIIIAAIFNFIKYVFISEIVLWFGLVIGCILIFYALFKYNKGIF